MASCLFEITTTTQQLCDNCQKVKQLSDIAWKFIHCDRRSLKKVIKHI